MSIAAIRLIEIGKVYRLGESDPRFTTLRESAMAVLSRRWWSKKFSSQVRQHWALRDASFEIQTGEVVGLIGHNGAGKSTLLKIVSRITCPSRGVMEIRGRVGSLLEVGTGFHTELTGRENVFLSGVVLGMGRRQIASMFDDIVAFSGIDSAFLDTPVKRYSSGMQMRLAFAVAAFLDPEILLIDEVLAVGDAEFQKRCLGKIGEVARGGRTVLFVSHNMSAIQNLCTRVILLNQGSVSFDGDAAEGVRAYQQRFERSAESGPCDLRAGHFRLVHWSFSDLSGAAPAPLRDATFRFRVQSERPLNKPGLQFQVFTPEEVLLFSLDFRNFSTISEPIAPGDIVEFRFKVRSLPLMPGNYTVQVWFKNVDHGEVVPLSDRLPLLVTEVPVYANHSATVLRQWFGVVPVHAHVEHSVAPEKRHGQGPTEDIIARE